MKRILTNFPNYFLPTILLAASLLFSCKNEPGKTETATPVVLESVKVNKKEGTDCDKGEDFQNKCAEVSLSYPSVKTGNDALKKAVEDWSMQFITGTLNPAISTEDGPVSMPIDSAMQAFFQFHKEATVDMPEGPGYFTVEVIDTVLLNDGKRLTLKLDSYSYMGGAHPNSYSNVATFDVATGSIVKLENLVTDLNKLESLALAKFKVEKADAFAEGFEFTPDWPFALAANTGVTDIGIYFCYNPYEVTPYALGYTEFVLTFEELKDILK
jgi:hypothetical protein